TATYGKSRLANSLFFAKLYLSTLMTNVMVKINQSRDRRVFYVETGLDNDYEGAIQEVIRNVRQQDIPSSIFGDEESLSSVFKQMGSHENYYIPRTSGGTTPLDIDTIAGMQVDINDEFLEWLKKSVMAGTGVPFTYIDDSQETDYARSLSMQNNSFVRRVVAYQQSYGRFFSKILQRIYEINYSYEDDSKDKDTVSEININSKLINVVFPPPTFLNLQNNNERLNSIRESLEFYSALAVPSDDEDKARKFRLKFAQKKFGLNTDSELIENILKEIDSEEKEEMLKPSD